MEPPVSSGLRHRLLEETAGDHTLVDVLTAAWRLVDEPGAELRRVFMPVPAGVRAVVAPQLDLVGPVVSTVLLLAALDHPSEVETLLEAADLLHPQSGVPRTVDAVVATGLVTLCGRELRFDSSLIRSAVVDRASLAARVDAHTALASVLADRPVSASWHAGQATLHPDERVASYVERNAADAARLGGVAERLRRLECAARLTPSPRRRALRLIAAGVAGYEMGRPDVGQHLVDQALVTYDDPDLEAHAEGVRSRLAARPPRTFHQVDVVCAQARASLDSGRYEAACSLLLSAAHSLFWSTGDHEHRTRVLELMQLIPAQFRTAQYAAVLSTVDPAAADGTESLTDAERQPPGALDRLRGVVAWNRGDVDRAADLFADAAPRLRHQALDGLLTHVQCLAAQAGLIIGSWRDAEHDVEEALSLARSTDQPVWEAQALATRGLAAALHGRVRDASLDFTEAKVLVAGSRYDVILATVRLGRGIALGTAARWQEGYAHVRRIFDGADLAQCRPQVLSALGFLAEAAVAADCAEDARSVLARVTDASSSGRAHRLFATAVVAGSNAAEGHFRAATGSELDGFPWLRARTQLAYGSWLRRQRRAVEAREPLWSALQTFEDLQAPLWTYRARGELRATGAASGGLLVAVADGTGVLSAQELRIVELAAEGLSNREIGQAMYLSPRTIGSHLYRIFPKLGIAKRAQLAGLVSGTVGSGSAAV